MKNTRRKLQKTTIPLTLFAGLLTAAGDSLNRHIFLTSSYLCHFRAATPSIVALNTVTHNGFNSLRYFRFRSMNMVRQQKRFYYLLISGVRYRPSSASSPRL